MKLSHSAEAIQAPMAPSNKVQKATLKLEPESIIDHLMVCEEFFRWSVEKPELCQSLVRLVSDKDTQTALGQYLNNLHQVLGQRLPGFLSAMRECRRDILRSMLEDQRVFDAITGANILTVPLLWHFSVLAQQYWQAFLQPEDSWLNNDQAKSLKKDSWVNLENADDDVLDDVDGACAITSHPNINPVGFCGFGAADSDEEDGDPVIIPLYQDPSQDPTIHSCGSLSFAAVNQCPHCRTPKANNILVTDLRKKVFVFERFLLPQNLIRLNNLTGPDFSDPAHRSTIYQSLGYADIFKAYIYAVKISGKPFPAQFTRDYLVKLNPALTRFRSRQNKQQYETIMSRVVLFDSFLCEKFIGSTRNAILVGATAAGLRGEQENSLDFLIDGRGSVDLLFRWITIHGAQEPLGFSLSDSRFWALLSTCKSLPREVKERVYTRLLSDPQEFTECVATAQVLQDADLRRAFASILFDAISSTIESDPTYQVRPGLEKSCQDLMVLLGKPAYDQVSQGKPLSCTEYIRQVSTFEKSTAASEGWSELLQEMTTIFTPARQLSVQQVVLERLTSLGLESMIDLKQVNILRGYAADTPLDLSAIYLRMRKILMQQTVMIIPFDYSAKDFLLKESQTQGGSARPIDFADISAATLRKLEGGLSPFRCYLAILSKELVKSAFEYSEKCFVILSEEAKREACFGLQGATDRYTSTSLNHIAHLLPHLSDQLFTQLAIYAITGECAGNLPLKEISVSFPLMFSIKRHLTHVHLSKRDVEFTKELQSHTNSLEKITRSIPVTIMKDQAFVTKSFVVARMPVAFSEIQNPYIAHLQKIVEILQTDTTSTWFTTLQKYLSLTPGFRNMVMPDQYHHSLIGFVLKKEKVEVQAVVACLIDLIKLDANPCIPDCVQGGYYPLQYLIAGGGVAAVGKVEFHSIVNAYFALRSEGQVLDPPVFIDPEAKERQRIQGVKNLREEFPVLQFMFNELRNRKSLAGDLLRHPNLIQYLCECEEYNVDGTIEYVPIIGEICTLAKTAFDEFSFGDNLEKNCILLLGHSRIPSHIKLFIYAHVPEMTENLWASFEDPIQRERLFSATNARQMISVMVKSLSTSKENTKFIKLRAFKLFCGISPELAKGFSLDEKVFLGKLSSECVLCGYAEALHGNQNIELSYSDNEQMTKFSDTQRKITKILLRSPLCFRPNDQAENNLSIDFLAAYHFACVNSDVLLVALLSNRYMSLSTTQRLTLCQQLVRTNLSESGWGHFFKQYGLEPADEKQLLALFLAAYPNKVALRAFVEVMALNATAVKIFQGYFRQAANMAHICDADKVVGEWRWPQHSTFSSNEPNDLVFAWARSLYLEGQKEGAVFNPATLKNYHTLLRYWCQQRKYFSPGGKPVLVIDKTSFLQRVRSPRLFLAISDDATKACRYPIQLFQHIEDIVLMNFETSDQLIVSLENLARQSGALLEPLLNAAALRLREAFNDAMLTPALIQLEIASLIGHPNLTHQVGAVANFGKQAAPQNNMKTKLIELLRDYKNSYPYQLDKSHIECGKF